MTIGGLQIKQENQAFSTLKGEGQEGKSPSSLLFQPISPSSLLFGAISPSSLKFGLPALTSREIHLLRPRLKTCLHH